MKKVLVTGVAGFIGYHLTNELLIRGFNVVGLDVINNYYDISLKYDRIRNLGISKEFIKHNVLIDSSDFENFKFVQADLTDSKYILDLMENQKFDYVVNLAAQAGVRYSIENPFTYLQSNVHGFLSILEGARHTGVQHLVYASTSSVYGLNTRMPLAETMTTDHPMALYAATKKSNEMMAHSYSHLFNLPTSGLRFFTVYGPWGRPDMALFLFAEAIKDGRPINVYNHGKMIRDFTYVGDIVESIVRLVSKPPTPNKSWDSDSPTSNLSSAPYRIFNVGNGSPTKLMDYINALEIALGKKGIYNLMDIQPGDVPATHADTSSLEDYLGFKPNTPVSLGVSKFVDWYKDYYRVQ